MRATLVIAVAAVASCLLVSCAPKEPDTAGLKKSVADFNAASKAALEGGDMNRPLTFYADDGMEMAPYMAAAKGRDAIKAMWTQMMSSGVKMTNVQFTTLDVQASGTIGYEIGKYDMTVTPPGMGEMRDSGKYLTLWRQQADGSWKVVAETWNTDMPMPSMEKPASTKK